ncbi:MAG: XRE family transcriptional regulator, partial [Clostridia bacterium]|nr:XRE family transcriptional regulator [Clostridia bacterium]
MTMGERIKQLRKENGMTQTALAEALGVTKGTVSTWETNN